MRRRRSRPSGSSSSNEPSAATSSAEHVWNVHTSTIVGVARTKSAQPVASMLLWAGVFLYVVEQFLRRCGC
jgi:hypothetical protein